MLSEKNPNALNEDDGSKNVNPKSNSRSRTNRPCLTCRRRKISCDKTRPKCKRCAQTGYECEGYGEDRHFVYVVPIRASPTNTGSVQKTKKVTLKSSRQFPSDQWLPQYHHQGQFVTPPLSPFINSADFNRLQIVSHFLDRYIPNHPSSQQRENTTPLTWLRSLPESLGKWDFLDMAMTALSLVYLGDIHHNLTFQQQGEVLYDRALKHMRVRLYRNQIDEGLLACCMCMSIYELIHTSDGGTQGWMFHVKGACHLLELRGPPSEESPLDMNLIRRIRAAALWDSYASGRPTFLAKPEWCGLSDTPYDQLLDILLRLCSLAARSDRIETMVAQGEEICAVAATEKLLYSCRALRNELVTWYADFQSKEMGPLFDLEPEEQHPFLDPSSDLNDLFPVSLTFRTPYIAQILLLYWYGEVVIHTIMLKVYPYKRDGQTPHSDWHQSRTSMENITAQQQQQQQIITDDGTIANIETIGDYYASKICQAMAGCGRNSLRAYGFQIALVPLWAASEFYTPRSPRKSIWCRTVLSNFSTRGFVLAQSLGSTPIRQYPGRYLEYAAEEEIGFADHIN